MTTEIRLECGKIPEMLKVEEIIRINRIVTEPEKSSAKQDQNGTMKAEIAGSGFEVSRDEDYHHIRERGQLETLVDTMLPYECREQSEMVSLTAFLMSEIARSQIFAEGNKRTSYVAGTLLLIKAQMLARNEAIYPRLDKEMTDILSEVARGHRGRDDLEEYLTKRLSMQ